MGAALPSWLTEALSAGIGNAKGGDTLLLLGCTLRARLAAIRVPSDSPLIVMRPSSQKKKTLYHLHRLVGSLWEPSVRLPHNLPEEPRPGPHFGRSLPVDDGRVAASYGSISLSCVQTWPRPPSLHSLLTAGYLTARHSKLLLSLFVLNFGQDQIFC